MEEKQETEAQTQARKLWSSDLIRYAAGESVKRNRMRAVLYPIVAALCLAPLFWTLKWAPYYTGYLIMHLFFHNPMRVSLARLRLNLSGDVAPRHDGASDGKGDARNGNASLRDLFFAFGKHYFHIVWVMLYLELRVLLRIVSFAFLPEGVKAIFSQRLAPYLLAETPALSGKETARISGAMMEGEKKQSFFLDVSYIGYFILSGVTFGVFGLLWGGPVSEQATAELYDFLRYKDAYAEINRDEEKPRLKPYGVIVYVAALVAGLFALYPAVRHRALTLTPFAAERTQVDDALIAMLQADDVDYDALFAMNPLRMSDVSGDALAAHVSDLRAQRDADAYPYGRMQDDPSVLAYGRLIDAALRSKNGTGWFRLMTDGADRAENALIEEVRNLPEDADEATVYELDVALTRANWTLSGLAVNYKRCYDASYETIDDLSDFYMGRLIDAGMADMSYDHYIRALARKNTPDNRPDPFVLFCRDEYDFAKDFLSAVMTQYGALSFRAADVVPLGDLLFGRLKDRAHDAPKNVFSALYTASMISRGDYVSEAIRRIDDADEEAYALKVKLVSDCFFTYNEGTGDVGWETMGYVLETARWERCGIAVVYEDAALQRNIDAFLTPEYLERICDLAAEDLESSGSDALSMYTEKERADALTMLAYGTTRENDSFSAIGDIPLPLYAETCGALTRKIYFADPHYQASNYVMRLATDYTLRRMEGISE